jgi:hypothetical protein
MAELIIGREYMHADTSYKYISTGTAYIFNLIDSNNKKCLLKIDNNEGQFIDTDYMNFINYNLTNDNGQNLNIDDPLILNNLYCILDQKYTLILIIENAYILKYDASILVYHNIISDETITDLNDNLNGLYIENRDDSENINYYKGLYSFINKVPKLNKKINPIINYENTLEYISKESILSYQMPSDLINDLYTRTWSEDNKAFLLYSGNIMAGSNMIIQEKYDIKCRYNYRAINLEWFNDFYKYAKFEMARDFYVFRSDTYNPPCINIHDFFSKGRKVFEQYSTRSTTYDFNFINDNWIWDTNKYIYIIKVSKSEKYIVLKNTSQAEITLAPGKFTITDAKKYKFRGADKLVLFVNYKSYSFEEFAERFNLLNYIQSTEYIGDPIVITEKIILDDLKKKYEFKYRYGGKYYEKYIKYKTKYIDLKNKII